MPFLQALILNSLRSFFSRTKGQRGGERDAVCLNYWAFKRLKGGRESGGAFWRLRRVGGASEDLPDAVNPVQMLGLHQGAAQASQSFAVAANIVLQRDEEANGQFGDCQVQAALGSSREDCSRLRRHFAHTVGARREDHDVQFGTNAGTKRLSSSIFCTDRVLRICCAPGPSQFAALHQRQQFMSGP